MRRKHCSDEQLLQFLDGELKMMAKAAVPWHLRSCWRCRARLAAIEGQIRSLLLEIDEHPFPAEALQAARDRFWRAAAAVDTEDQRNPWRFSWRIPARRVLLGAGVSISAFALWHFAPIQTVVPEVAETKVTKAPTVASSSLPPIASAPAVSLPIPKYVPPVVMAEEKTLLSIDLDDLEVRTLYALHQAQSCLGGEIRLVAADSQHLDLVGFVESDARRARIAELFAQSIQQGALRLKIRTPAEFPPVALPPLSVSSATPADELDRERMPLESDLIRAYGVLYPGEGEGALDKRVLALSNEVLRLATIALDHAWAIQNMATRYPASRIDGLRSELGGLVKTMVRDHVSGLAGTGAELSEKVMPLLDAIPITDSQPEEAGSESWQASAGVLLRDVKQLHEDAHQLFSLTGHKVDDPDACARRFRATLARIVREANAARF
jgi:hypothetical protein